MQFGDRFIIGCVCAALTAGCNGDTGTSSEGSTDAGTTSTSATTGPAPDGTTTGTPTPTTGEEPTDSGMSASQSTSSSTTTTEPVTASETDADTSTGDTTLADTSTGETTDTDDTGDTTTTTTETTDTDTSTGEPDPVCGDGQVGGDEQCDDANADNTDNCVEGCKLATCGDGFVGPGEGCDDANDVPDDACGNDCAPASCGDGIVQQGEQCDDKNGANDDACLGTCALATCGDGFVHQGVETCDDGNPANDDACTTLCAPPSCADGLQSGTETDVDCGGNCDECGLGDACGGPSDCDSGACDSGTCVLAPSCAAVKAAQPNAADGLYPIDPDGLGPAPEISVYCDMTTDGGGWALAIRFAPVNGQFHFYSPHWTTQSLVNENVPGPTDPSDGKFPAYNALPGQEIRGCLKHPGNQTYGCKHYPLPATTTLLDLFKNTPVGSDIAMKGLYFNGETQAEKLQWLTMQGRSVAEASIQPAYVAVGINIDDDQSCYDARVRFGLVLNNEVNITTLNDAAGFGAQAYYTVQCDLQPGVDTPWRTACGFQAGQTSYHTAGHIWIR